MPFTQVPLERLRPEHAAHYIPERRYMVRGLWKLWMPIGISPLDKFSTIDKAMDRVTQAKLVETAKERVEYRIRLVRSETVLLIKYSP